MVFDSSTKKHVNKPAKDDSVRASNTVKGDQQHTNRNISQYVDEEIPSEYDTTSIPPNRCISSMAGVSLQQTCHKHPYSFVDGFNLYNFIHGKCQIPELTEFRKAFKASMKRERKSQIQLDVINSELSYLILGNTGCTGGEANEVNRLLATRHNVQICINHEKKIQCDLEEHIQTYVEEKAIAYKSSRAFKERQRIKNSKYPRLEGCVPIPKLGEEYPDTKHAEIIRKGQVCAGTSVRPINPPNRYLMEYMDCKNNYDDITPGPKYSVWRNPDAVCAEGNTPVYIKRCRRQEPFAEYIQVEAYPGMIYYCEPVPQLYETENEYPSNKSRSQTGVGQSADEENTDIVFSEKNSLKIEPETERRRSRSPRLKSRQKKEGRNGKDHNESLQLEKSKAGSSVDESDNQVTNSHPIESEPIHSAPAYIVPSIVPELEERVFGNPNRAPRFFYAENQTQTSPRIEFSNAEQLMSDDRQDDQSVEEISDLEMSEDDLSNVSALVEQRTSQSGMSMRIDGDSTKAEQLTSAAFSQNGNRTPGMRKAQQKTVIEKPRAQMTVSGSGNPDIPSGGTYQGVMNNKSDGVNEMFYYPGCFTTNIECEPDTGYHYTRDVVVRPLNIKMRSHATFVEPINVQPGLAGTCSVKSLHNLVPPCETVWCRDASLSILTRFDRGQILCAKLMNNMDNTCIEIRAPAIEQTAVLPYARRGTIRLLNNNAQIIKPTFEMRKIFNSTYTRHFIDDDAFPDLETPENPTYLTRVQGGKPIPTRLSDTCSSSVHKPLRGKTVLAGRPTCIAADLCGDKTETLHITRLVNPEKPEVPSKNRKEVKYDICENDYGEAFEVSCSMIDPTGDTPARRK